MWPQRPINKHHVNQLSTWVYYLEGGCKAWTFLPGYVEGHIPESGAFSEVLSTTVSLKLFTKENIFCCFVQKIIGLRGSTAFSLPLCMAFQSQGREGNNIFAFSSIPLKHHVTHSWTFQHVSWMSPEKRHLKSDM